MKFFNSDIVSNYIINKTLGLKSKKNIYGNINTSINLIKFSE